MLESISIEGATDAIACLTTAAEVASSPSSLMRQLGEDLEAFAKERFDTETDPDGNPWADLSPSYRSYKQSRGYSTKKNQRTGAATRAIASRAYTDQVEAGVEVPYFERIQESRPVFPSREPLPTSLETIIEQRATRQFQILLT